MFVDSEVADAAETANLVAVRILRVQPVFAPPGNTEPLLDDGDGHA